MLEGRNWKRIFEKTRVGFGRREVSGRLDGIVFSALSCGHGPEIMGSEGVWKRLDFHDCFVATFAKKHENPKN